MTKSLHSFFLLLCLCAALATGCRKDDDNPLDKGDDIPDVTTTIVGLVSDEDGGAMIGATVSAYGHTATTNEHGLFVIRNVRVPENRCFVLVRKDGYLTGSRAEKPKANGMTNMRLSMMREIHYNVNSSVGGAVDVSEGGSIELPANAYVTGSGSLYSGPLRVVARWLNPASSKFYDFFPGDFTATRTDGSQTELYSYGVLNVELSASSTGEKLQLASGKKATLKYPIPSEMLPGAPAEMPLWYFDEVIGMWKEDGKAVKQGNFYVGQVSHFTPWNCDVPVQTGFIKGRVSCNNESFPGAVVHVGEREVITDEDGNYECSVPIGMTLTVNIDPADNLGTGSAAPLTVVGPVTRGQTVVADILVSPCPAYVKGTLVGCSSAAIDGIVEIVWQGGYTYSLIGSTGNFRAMVPNSLPIEMTFQGFAAGSGTSTPLFAAPLAEGETRDIGTVSACGGNTAATYVDIAERNYGGLWQQSGAFSPDASLFACSFGHSINVFDTHTGELVREIDFPEAYYGGFNGDGSLLMGVNATGNVHLWNTSAWALTKQIPQVGGSEMKVLAPDGQSLIFTRRGMSTQSPPQYAVKLLQYIIATGETKELYEAENEQEEIVSLPHMRNNGQQIVFTMNSLDAGIYSTKVLVYDMNQGIVVNRTVYTGGYPEHWSTISANGNRIALYTEQRLVIFDVDSGTQLLALDGKLFADKTQWPIALSPDGSTFAASFADKKQRPFGIYSVQGGTLVKVLPVPIDTKQAISSYVCFSADGTMVSGRSDRYRRIWYLQ